MAMARNSAGPPKKREIKPPPPERYTEFNLQELCEQRGWVEDDYVLGIDEAGRGPALGTMVYGAAYCRIRDHPELVGFGVADSKQLTEAAREAIHDRIAASDAVRYGLRQVTAEEISEKQLSRIPMSLNKISHAAQVELVQRIQDEIRGVRVADGVPEAKRHRSGGRLVGIFADVVGTVAYHHSILSKAFPECHVIVQSKADSVFPVTSAASIMAKVSRDRGLRAHQYLEDVDAGRAFGSGYPSDPYTTRWLGQNVHKVFVYPRIARFDWDPVKRVEKERCVEVVWVKDELKEPAQKWHYFQEMWSSPAVSF
eukprot:TRINITY_DN9022_c0_g1_i1.p1 TRINITY_DN9022_c0_g1~~TRINITY_DN9022_c0_g1_i1.p1  ORF type:complete len:333 (+),score=122.23 TRINITY_DN9022_c0_g1_i1:66-1001(+)